MFYKSLGFLYTNYELWPVYKGERINETINIKDSLSFSRNNPENRFKQYEIPLYGTTYHFTFPTPEDKDLLNNFVEEIPDDHVDISFQIYDKVIDMSGYWFINDYVVGLWKQIVQTFHVIETPEGWWYLLFRRNTNVWRYSDLLDQAAIIMAKDALMGLWNNEKLKYKPSKSAPEEEFPISRDYEMQDPRDKTKKLTIKDNFSIWLRDALLRQMLESWNADPAHTKFQRNTLLQRWQIEYLKRRERRTVALCPRRCLHEDTLITLKDWTSIRAGDLTTDHELLDGKSVVRIVRSKQKWYKITTGTRNEIIVSKNHYIPTMENWDEKTDSRDYNEDHYIRIMDLTSPQDILNYSLPIYTPSDNADPSSPLAFTLYKTKDKTYKCPIQFSPVIAIEETEEVNMIDIETDDDHTFVANGIISHNSGKSLLMAIEVLTRMLQYNHKKWVRPLTILYLSKDTSTYKTVLDYIDATLAQIGFLKSFFHYDSKAAIYYFRDPISKQVYSQCKFLTAEGKTPWVGSAADWVFIDEAMMIKPSVFERIFPIVTHEWAGLTVMSTFYDTLEDGDQVYDRPIKLCNEYEKVSSKILDIDSHILKQYDHFVNNGEYPEESVAGLRFTIDDVDVILGKEKIKEDYSVDQDKYMKELYCRAPKKTTAFNFRPRLCTANYDAKEHKRELADKDGVKMIPNYFDTIIISYDPARTTDMSALTTIWYSKSRNKVSVIREQQLNFVDKSSFLTQAELIKEEFARAKWHGHNVYFVMDWSHPWVADALTWAGISIFRAYRFTWGNQARKGNQYFERHVPKKLMVEALRYLLDNNIVEIWSTCPLTIDQLDKFVEFVNPSTNVSTFQWVQAHDDFVCSLMVWARCLYEDFSFKYGTPQTSSPVDKPAYDIVKPQKPIIQSAYWLNFNFLY